MDKLVELLNALKDNKLDKTYNRIMTDIADIKSALSVVNEEVNDAILALLSEGKYEEVNKLTSIPGLGGKLVVQIDDFFSFEGIDNAVKELNFIEKKEEIIMNTSKEIEVVETEVVKSEEVLPYTGIITSVKGLRVGAKVLHKSFGIGQIVSIEDTENGNGKVLRVLFDAYGEKPFSCTPAVLVKFFGFDDEEKLGEDISNKEEIEKPIIDSFSEEKMGLEPPKYFNSLFRKIETIIFRQHLKVEREQMPESYKYSLFGNRVCYVNFRNKYLNIYFNVPFEKMENRKGLLIKNKSHQVHVPCKIVVDETVSLEDIEFFIIQAFNHYK